MGTISLRAASPRSSIKFLIKSDRSATARSIRMISKTNSTVAAVYGLDSVD